MYLNKAIIVGNLTRDPELKSLPSGGSVTNFSVATNETWNDKDGNKQERVEFHNVIVFGRQAETTAQYLKKGQGVLVEGKIQTRSWDGEDGKKNYRTEINAERVQFGQKNESGQQNQQSAPQQQTSVSANNLSQYNQDNPNQSGGNDIDLESIPF